MGTPGDRRAVKPLCQLTLDEHAATDARTEAARLLGKLADDKRRRQSAGRDEISEPLVSAEAAIALGRLFDARAAAALRRLVAAEDPGIRSRAAISLGRLRDRAAVPCADRCAVDCAQRLRTRRSRALAGPAARRACARTLINLLPEARTRHLVVVAMGELGDKRAFTPLSQVLGWDRNTNVRDGVVTRLGHAGGCARAGQRRCAGERRCRAGATPENLWCGCTPWSASGSAART